MNKLELLHLLINLIPNVEPLYQCLRTNFNVLKLETTTYFQQYKNHPMRNNFNLKHYIELLEKNANLERTEDITETEKRELLSYGARIERQISYNRKDQYFSLIREYLAKIINPNTFRGKFLKMQKADDDATQILEQDFEQLSCFSIDLEEGTFSSLIDRIYNISMLAVEFGPEDGISEDEFRDSIEAEFSKCKNLS